MRNKIAFKLSMGFAATLLIFSIIIGSVFMLLFNSHTIELHKTELENRAVTMANSLSEYIDGTNSGSGMMGGGLGGYRAYLHFLDDIAMTDVWIVDEDLALIIEGTMLNYQYADLPQDAEEVVNEVFKGNTTFSQGFSDLLESPALTVGTPIKSNGRVIGALLLHSPIEGLDKAIAQGIGILSISVLVALIISILLSIILAVAFTRPLKKMKHATMQLVNGDYTAKTDVHRKDEIGELADEIDILSERLELASLESEQLLKLRHDFVANISHELRTPITVIRGSLEALCEKVVTEPEQVKDYHQQMLNESLYLQRLVDELLDLSLLQNADFRMEMQELNLCDIVDDVVRSGQHLAQSKNIKIRQIQDTQKCIAYGDYGRLRQMLLIVLDNAIKFSPYKGVVTISFNDRTISIIDNGIGIEEKDLRYIFDRFYKVKSQQNVNGTGLGLAIAKQIADKHNIAISVNSGIDEITEFVFQFK